MILGGGGKGTRTGRVAEASDWFARMRGPEAEAERAAFEAWRKDPENSRAYDEIAKIWEIAGASAQLSSLAPAMARRPGWLVPSLIAAGLGTALVLGLIVNGYTGWHGQIRELVYAGVPGALREVSLPDGSHVTLDHASRISVAFGRDERRVTLIAGRARFAVTHDGARPFVVLAGDRAVVARGTVFDVRLERGAMEVTLLEGAVDLEQRATNAPPRRVGRLRPGQAATFVSSDAPPLIVEAPADAWAGVIVSGDSMRLADVVALANRASATKIVLEAPDLADLRVSGGYRPTDASALAASLAAALDLAIDRRADGSIVLARTPRTPRALSQPCTGAPCPSS